MEVIVLGGAGDMGSRAVEDLAATEEVERVTIADRNIEAARRIAARLPGQGAEVDVPARWGLFASRRIRGAAARLVARLERLGGEAEPAEGAVRLDVWGEIDGEKMHRLACGIGQMREATGLSLSVGTLMLARGELLVEGGGVYAPEGYLEPMTFLARLSEKGIKAYWDLEMTRPVA